MTCLLGLFWRPADHGRQKRKLQLSFARCRLKELSSPFFWRSQRRCKLTNVCKHFTEIGKNKMVKYCRYKNCSSNSSNVTSSVTFIPFPKPWIDRARAEDWIRLCGLRDYFPVESINADTRVCSLHFPSSPENSFDWRFNQELTPFKYEEPEHHNGNLKLYRSSKKYHPAEMRKKFYHFKKSKATIFTAATETTIPTATATTIAAATAATITEATATPAAASTATATLAAVQSETLVSDATATPASSATATPAAAATATPAAVPTVTSVSTATATPAVATTGVCLTAVARNTSEMQKYCNKKVQAHVSPENELVALKMEIVELHRRMLPEQIKVHPVVEFRNELLGDEKKFKFYTGLTIDQFKTVFNFAGGDSVQLNYWMGSRQPKYKKFKILSNEIQLLLTVVRLRMGYTLRDMSYRFKISVKDIQCVFVTWVQNLYSKYNDIRSEMYVQREYHDPLPRAFQNRYLKKTRIVLDATEFLCEGSRDYQQQGHLYSQYKGHNTTAKVVLGVAPSGKKRKLEFYFSMFIKWLTFGLVE